MAVRTLFKFVVGRAKTLFKNYNVVERAEKTMEIGKRAPPRHPGTEAKFKVLIKERPEMLDDMTKKPVELLDRLKIVKVSSEGGPQDDEIEGRSLPQRRNYQQLPTYGFEEPKTISEGKCTLRQALQFITNHQNNPSVNSVDAIAKMHNMKASDVDNIVKNFQVLELYVPRDKKVTLAKSVLKTLGANKIRKQLYSENFKNVKPDIETTVEEKK